MIKNSKMTRNLEWDEKAEIEFNNWFHENYGTYSFRSEAFYSDCEIGDIKTRQDIMYKYLHSAFCSGYNVGRLNQHHKNLDGVYDKIEQHIEETDELLKEVDEFLK